MALVFLGFEWKSYERVIEIEEVVQTEVIEEIEIIQTARNEPPPPPPPQVVTTLLNIVDNTVVIDNDWEIDAEADDRLGVTMLRLRKRKRL